VSKLALRQPGLFSSANQRDILIYKEDFDTPAMWSVHTLTDITCRIQQLRSKVEHGGQTRFLLMVTPDKLTAYSQELQTTKWAHSSQLPALSALNPQLMPRLDLVLRSAIKQRHQDIYLPNDTHWGPQGHKLAADTMLTFLRQH
jgi:hypothetical protein